MNRLHLLLSALVLAGATISGAAAQSPPPPPLKPAFPQLFPKPTGKNGYEELVQAGDLVKSSKLFGQYENADDGAVIALATKRRVLADRPVTQALALVKQGLAKPVFSPREKLSLETLLPELSPLRSVGKLLALQEYVLLADGRTTEALQSFRAGLRLGYVVQTDTIISGLVGVAITRLVTQPIAAHLDQFSARDCDLLYQISMEGLRAPNPEPQILAMERKWMRSSLEDMREKAKRQGVAALASDFSVDLKTAEPFIKALDSPEKIDELFTQLSTRLDAYYAQQLKELQKEPWERKLSEPENDGTLAGMAMGFVAAPTQNIDNAYTTWVARLRLMAVHAAVRRYRWEYNKLPETLDTLNLAQLVIDPFTGQTLQYRVTGPQTFRLSSVGPEAQPDNPRQVDGRVPVSIIPGE